MKYSTIFSIVLLVGCGGGANNDPTNIPFPSASTSTSSADQKSALISATSLTLPDINAKSTALCEGDLNRANWRIKPANLSNHKDGRKDIIVMSFCLPLVPGAASTAPVIGGLFIFLQDSNGNFQDKTKQVLGTELFKVDGVMYGGVAQDFNNDGYDEVFLYVSGEDGRLLILDGGPPEILQKQQLVLTSRGDGTYRAESLGKTTMGDQVKIVKNSSNYDVLMNGFAGTPGDHNQAFRLVNNVWTDVSDYYFPIANLQNSPYASASFFSTNSSNIDAALGGNWLNEVILHQKINNEWKPLDKWSLQSTQSAPYKEWSGGNSTVPLYKINGLDVGFLAFNVNCQINDGKDLTHLFLTNAMSVKGGYTGQALTMGNRDDFDFVTLLFSFGVENGKIKQKEITINKPIINQNSVNTMNCRDFTGDSVQDIFIPTQGSNPKPIIYVNKLGVYHSVNQALFPSVATSRISYAMLYEDINGDNIPDILHYPILPDKELSVTIRLFNGLRKITEADLN